MNKKKILIIRSASFQQLDKNLPELVNKYQDYSFELLTHEHGMKLAEKYAHIDEVISYPYKGSFFAKNKVDVLNNKEYNKVIVLVTNVSGSGFWNVVQFAFTIKADEYLQCNMNSTIKKITRKKMITDWFLKGFLKSAAAVLTALVSIIIIPYIIIWVKINNRKRLDG